MMADLRELYQETILDHSKRPRHFHEIPNADVSAGGHNPLCGDRVTVFLRLSDGVLADVASVGQGCALSNASASLMTDAVKRTTKAQAHELLENVRRMMPGRPGAGSLPAARGARVAVAFAAPRGRGLPVRGPPAVGHLPPRHRLRRNGRA